MQQQQTWQAIQIPESIVRRWTGLIDLALVQEYLDHADEILDSYGVPRRLSAQAVSAWILLGTYALNRERGADEICYAVPGGGQEWAGPLKARAKVAHGLGLAGYGREETLAVLTMRCDYGTIARKGWDYFLADCFWCIDRKRPRIPPPETVVQPTAPPKRFNSEKAYEVLSALLAGHNATVMDPADLAVRFGVTVDKMLRCERTWREKGMAYRFPLPTGGTVLILTGVLHVADERVGQTSAEEEKAPVAEEALHEERLFSRRQPSLGSLLRARGTQP